MFELHPRLSADSIHIHTLSLCDVRLINDEAYPWVVLVPQRDGIREIHELTANDQDTLTREMSFVSQRLQAMTGADKMNIAALGNMVPQLHIHVIARFESDPAWPGPIWGVQEACPYSEQSLATTIRSIEQAIAL